MIGNDDCGQMSAWYIFSTLGFYPANPASGEYVIGQPQITSATLYLKDGKLFQIENNNSKSILLNGKPMDGFTISHKQISAGGVLNF